MSSPGNSNKNVSTQISEAFGTFTDHQKPDNDRRTASYALMNLCDNNPDVSPYDKALIAYQLAVLGRKILRDAVREHYANVCLTACQSGATNAEGSRSSQADNSFKELGEKARKFLKDLADAEEEAEDDAASARQMAAIRAQSQRDGMGGEDEYDEENDFDRADYGY